MFRDWVNKLLCGNSGVSYNGETMMVNYIQQIRIEFQIKKINKTIKLKRTEDKISRQMSFYIMSDLRRIGKKYTERKHIFTQRRGCASQSFREHAQKAALLSDIRKSRNKRRTSKNLRPSKFEFHALIIQPRMLRSPRN